VSFIEHHALWTPAQTQAAQEVARRVSADGVDLVRLSFPDLHGILRGKALVADALPAALRSGCAITSTLLLKDTSHRTVVPIFEANAGIGLAGFEGGADVVMVPDPTTFRMLPWAARTGWMLCDLYHADGTKVDIAPRHLMRAALARLAALGYDFIAGLEVEFTLTRLLDAKMALEESGQPGSPPDIALLHHGYNYLTEQSLDRMDPILEILRRDVLALGLNLRSVEVEFGPSQCEFVFQPATRRRHDPVPQCRQADLPQARLSCLLHVQAAHSQCDVQRLAFASIAAASGYWRKRLHAVAARRVALARRHALPGRAAPGCLRGQRLHGAHHQWLPALSGEFAGTRPRGLEPR
jgi:hypothetical protein